MVSQRTVFVALFAALGLSGCAESAEPTEVILSVTSELSTPDELDALHVRIEGPEGRVELVTEELATEGLPRTLSIYHPEGTLGPFRVTVTGLLDGTPIVVRRAVFSILEGRSRRVEFPLSRACAGPEAPACSCPNTRVCSTCDAGQRGPVCRDAVVLDKSLVSSDARITQDAGL